jgi:acetate kinase
METSPSKPPADRVLIINGGSSSIKFAVFESGETLKRVFTGKIEGIGQQSGHLTVKDFVGAYSESRSLGVPSYAIAVSSLFAWFQKRIDLAAFTIVGHRIVHGGPNYSVPTFITPTLIKELRRLTPFDPEHLPDEIMLIDELQLRFPKLKQIACFDTAFHHDLPRVAQQLPIPRRFEAQGVRRYGFHGLSYAHLLQELERVAGKQAANGRVILAHLGNGASLAAIRDGHCQDTSMSFTPAAGLMMGTRSGDIDPGLASIIMKSEQISSTFFDEMMNHESGLLGVSETSSDMRVLLANEESDVRASEAIALFCYQVKKWIGAYAAVLGGLDTLVFAGGIGENAPVIRERICAGLDFLDIQIDSKLNANNEAVISVIGSGAEIRVIHTDEELMIARSVLKLIQHDG